MDDESELQIQYSRAVAARKHYAVAQDRMQAVLDIKQHNIAKRWSVAQVHSVLIIGEYDHIKPPLRKPSQARRTVISSGLAGAPLSYGRVYAARRCRSPVRACSGLWTSKALELAPNRPNGFTPKPPTRNLVPGALLISDGGQLVSGVGEGLLGSGQAMV
ncbi:hypothetical protein FIBSPDRAFT_898414 [Athelia psychrophila]|uniref:Uncharacterized protein n=1 Tax=Athelia psychrophila TaxID=1759441 RepID=A0A166B242_9AGAM|nr:hypothetical protein FIBSPDRAFT_898414 [Fibularhizoctonia sp. CBS 109695]